MHMGVNFSSVLPVLTDQENRYNVHKSMRCVAAYQNLQICSIINARLRYYDRWHHQQRVTEIIAPGSLAVVMIDRYILYVML